LYYLFTHDCVARHDSNTIIKFADDAKLVSLISDNEVVRDLAVWCQNNNLSLNVSKTKELTHLAWVPRSSRSSTAAPSRAS
jgi:hypothetical protein